MTTDIDTNPAALVFALTATMTYEDSVKKMYSKTAGSALPSKMTMHAMIVITMAFESVCATARAVAAAAGIAYVPHTLLQYEAMINRAAHAELPLTFWRSPEVQCPLSLTRL